LKVEVVTHSSSEGIKEACGISRGNPFSEGMFKRILKAGHLSVLEHAFIVFKIEGISRVCSHEFVRNRIASYLQESQRHREISGVVKLAHFDSRLNEAIDYFEEKYNQAVDDTEDIRKEIPLEDLRYVAPQASVTSIVASYNLRSFWNLLDFRYCMRALEEYRNLARVMFVRASEVFPKVMKHWKPRCIKKYGRYCPEPCKKNVMEEFNKLTKGLFE
jgi:thymidylate synthase (FAD)